MTSLGVKCVLARCACGRLFGGRREVKFLCLMVGTRCCGLSIEVCAGARVRSPRDGQVGRFNHAKVRVRCFQRRPVRDVARFQRLAETRDGCQPRGGSFAPSVVDGEVSPRFGRGDYQMSGSSLVRGWAADLARRSRL
jgi:hypothetical protein